MYKDIVIKKRVWIDGDLTQDDIYDFLEYDEFEYESTIVDFNGRIPVEDGVIVGEWMTNGIQLIKADMGELIAENEEDRFMLLTAEKIDKFFSITKSYSGFIVPVCIYEQKGRSTIIELSNGEKSVAIDLKYFQYIYDGGFDYDLFSDSDNYGGLILKRDRLVCGAVMGMSLHNQDVIWQRPYSLADVEALNTIQGDPTLS